MDTQTQWVANGFTVCARVLVTASLSGEGDLKEHYSSRLTRQRTQLWSPELGDNTV